MHRKLVLEQFSARERRMTNHLFILVGSCYCEKKLHHKERVPYSYTRNQSFRNIRAWKALLWYKSTTEPYNGWRSLRTKMWDFKGGVCHFSPRRSRFSTKKDKRMPTMIPYQEFPETKNHASHWRRREEMWQNRCAHEEQLKFAKVQKLVNNSQHPAELSNHLTSDDVIGSLQNQVFKFNASYFPTDLVRDIYYKKTDIIHCFGLVCYPFTLFNYRVLNLILDP